MNIRTRMPTIEQREEHIDEVYIPWKEAAGLLGIGRSSFFYLVHSGQIRAEPGRAPRDGRYHLGDIQQIVERRAKGQKRKPRAKRGAPPLPLLLDWLSPNDIPAILKLDKIVYDHMFLAEMERYQQWSEKNGQLAYAAFDRRSHRETMLAYIACLPLPEEVIVAVMRGEREEVSITRQEIQTYDRPGGYVLLANSAVVHPDYPSLLRPVLLGMKDAWVERFPERYIERIYAQAVSQRGDLMISSFFMQPRYDLAPNAYMLDMTRLARSRIMRRFQAELYAKDQESYEQMYHHTVPKEKKHDDTYPPV